MLGGWLHRHTYFVAVNIIRTERRRQNREREAVAMNTLQDDSGTDFLLLAPILDETINQLGEEDRTAILLRFFEQRDFRSVGEALGSSEDAARMRVTRALEKLHLLLKRRGFTTGAGALGVALSANAVQSAPLGLAITVSASVSAATAASISTVIATTKTFAMTTMQKALVASTVAVLAGGGIYEAVQAANSRTEVKTLRQQQAPLTAQIQQLLQERNEMASRLSALADASEQGKRNDLELLKLRAEVTRLRSDSKELALLKAADPAQVELKFWLDRVKRLKQEFENNPRARIPEFSLLTEQDWLNSARLYGKRTQFDAETDRRVAMAELRQTAQKLFANVAQQALATYAKDHNGSFPADLAQFQSYLPIAVDGQPVDGTILQNYKIEPAEKYGLKGPGEDWVITQKELVDDEWDHHIAIGAQYWSYQKSEAEQLPQDILALKRVLDPAVKEFSAANDGQEPTEPSQIQPYLKTDEQKAALQKIMELQNARSQTNQ
jgi:hypothetical protein